MGRLHNRPAGWRRCPMPGSPRSAGAYAGAHRFHSHSPVRPRIPRPSSSTARSPHRILRPGERIGANRSARPLTSTDQRPASPSPRHGDRVGPCRAAVRGDRGRQSAGPRARPGRRGARGAGQLMYGKPQDFCRSRKDVWLFRDRMGTCAGSRCRHRGEVGGRGYRCEVTTCRATWPALLARMTGLTGKSETRNDPGSKSEPALAACGRRSRVTPGGAGWPVSQAFITGLRGKCQIKTSRGSNSTPALAAGGRRIMPLRSRYVRFSGDCTERSGARTSRGALQRRREGSLSCMYLRAARQPLS